MRVGRLSCYAVMVVKEMTHDATVSRRALAVKTKLSYTMVGKVLRRLLVKGLIESEAGIHGGYRLAGRKGAITMADVVEAVDRTTLVPPAPKRGSRGAVDIQRRAGQEVLSFLETVTVASL